MTRYEILVRVLDTIRGEAQDSEYARKYALNVPSEEMIWQARSRAYIHLYLQVMYGLDDFRERESFITDGGGDGGVDGFYIDRNNQIIILLQSKFRSTEDNFENKPITYSELLTMEVRRILDGEAVSAGGQVYNDHIRRMQSIISEIPDIGRYKYKIIVLANLVRVSADVLRKLADGFLVEVLNFGRAYDQLLFPVLQGTLFKATGLSVSLDLSNKSAGTKISYSVPVGQFDCEITVVFVPTLEIARVMTKYKNSILQFNPRSYLEFEGEKVNAAIRESILQLSGNEFALLNNGLTIICDESSVNEQSGRKHRAQLFLVNPQIINGGQTAYTLSRIYDSIEASQRDRAFAGKEVLVKIIALSTGEAEGENDRGAARETLIERISMATNSQSVVTHADRTSSDPLMLTLQEKLYRDNGILFERKRGEFAEAIKRGIITQNDVMPRNLFPRLQLAVVGQTAKAEQKKMRTAVFEEALNLNQSNPDLFPFAYRAFARLSNGKTFSSRAGYVQSLPQVYATRIIAGRLGGLTACSPEAVAELVLAEWPKFLSELEAGKAAALLMARGDNLDRVVRRKSNRGAKAPFSEEVARYFGRLPLPVEGALTVGGNVKQG